MRWEHVLVFGGEPCYAGFDAGLIQRAVAPELRSMEFGAKRIKEPVSRLVALSRCFLPFAEGWRRKMAPTSSFVPREAMLSLSDALQEEGIISPSVS